MRRAFDPEKDDGNKAKHGVSLSLAARVFDDPMHRIEPDVTEGSEVRWRIIGEVGGVILIVGHTIDEVDGEETAHLITARKADPGERRAYEESGAGEFARALRMPGRHAGRRVPTVRVTRRQFGKSTRHEQEGDDA